MPGTMGIVTPCLAAHVIPELKIVGIVEKQLSHDEIRAGIDFTFKVTPIGQLAGFAGNVAFGKTGDADAKVSLLPDKPNQLIGVLEAPWRQLKLASGRRVAAQRQHVLDAQLLDLAKQILDLLAG